MIRTRITNTVKRSFLLMIIGGFILVIGVSSSYIFTYDFYIINPYSGGLLTFSPMGRFAIGIFFGTIILITSAIVFLRERKIN